MEEAEKKIYITAEPKKLRILADEYKKAALMLKIQGKKHQPMSFAPFRLCAIHAIELYLNAFLLLKKMPEEDVRGLQHKLGERTSCALEKGLILRKLTVQHLGDIEKNREYLMTRYNPQMKPYSQINRLSATLEEVSKKVTAALPL